MTVTALARSVHFDATGNSVEGDYSVKMINWSGGANTNTCVINDQDDKLIWQGTANTGQLEFNVPIPNYKCKIIKVATLGGGEVNVWI